MKLFKESKEVAIQFAVNVFERGYEFLDYTDGVGLWQSEDGIVQTTEALYEDFVNVEVVIYEQDVVERHLRELSK